MHNLNTVGSLPFQRMISAHSLQRDTKRYRNQKKTEKTANHSCTLGWKGWKTLHQSASEMMEYRHAAKTYDSVFCEGSTKTLILKLSEKVKSESKKSNYFIACR
ncbi:hypothetical protein ATANTOWER_007856 [Ataeniobius toweri]|uniref:Uncharacterized protein n=1 Tax=Ataeniobius toweri TaxID=208326 RepID=A0ABU7AWP4_9TELE|nr:hypothetical protein [Ataeniobius toweri]